METIIYDPSSLGKINSVGYTMWGDIIYNPLSLTGKYSIEFPPNKITVSTPFSLKGQIVFKSRLKDEYLKTLVEEFPNTQLQKTTIPTDFYKIEYAFCEYGKPEIAKKIGERYIEENKNNPDALDDYASKNALYARKNLNNALKAAELAIKANPKNPAYWDTLARVYQMMGNDEKLREVQAKVQSLRKGTN
jgi:tetratricopeptide (TPR) repeat protein